MTIDLITADPDENNPATLPTEIDLFVKQVKAAIPQINALAAAMSLNAVTDVSSSSLTIGTGSKSLVGSAGKSFQPGMWISIADAAAPGTNAMYGVVADYDDLTGDLDFTSYYVLGSGTKTSWIISQSSPATQLSGRDLLSTVTASSSASCDLETTFDSNYDDYEITGTAIACGGSDLQCRMKLGGSYITTTTYRYHSGASSSASSSYAAAASDAASNIKIGPTAPTYVDFSMRIKNPTDTSRRKLINWNGAAMTASPALFSINGSGTNDSTSALTGIRFLLSTGNIATGTFRLYGIRTQ